MLLYRMTDDKASMGEVELGVSDEKSWVSNLLCPIGGRHSSIISPQEYCNQGCVVLIIAQEYIVEDITDPACVVPPKTCGGMRGDERVQAEWPDHAGHG